MATAQLLNLAHIRTGYQFRERAPFTPNGRYSVIQLKDSDTARLLDDQEFQKFDLDNVKDSDLVNQGDILLRAKGNNHYAVCVDRILTDCLAGGLSLVIQCDKQKILPEFLTWYLNQQPAQAFLHKISAGTSIPVVSKKALLELLVPVPPLAKQQSIGNLYLTLLKEEQLSHKLSNARQHFLNGRMLSLVKTEQSLNFAR